MSHSIHVSPNSRVIFNFLLSKKPEMGTPFSLTFTTSELLSFRLTASEIIDAIDELKNNDYIDWLGKSHCEAEVTIKKLLPRSPSNSIF